MIEKYEVELVQTTDDFENFDDLGKKIA